MFSSQDLPYEMVTPLVTAGWLQPHYMPSAMTTAPHIPGEPGGAQVCQVQLPVASGPGRVLSPSWVLSHFIYREAEVNAWDEPALPHHPLLLTGRKACCLQCSGGRQCARCGGRRPAVADAHLGPDCEGHGFTHACVSGPELPLRLRWLSGVTAICIFVCMFDYY